MPWFLALNATPAKGVQAPTYELHETADIERIIEEMATFAATDRAVAVPAVFNSGRQQVNVYVRPAAWGAWAVYELSEEERREMMANNPLVNALAQARAAKQQGQQAPPMFAPQQPPSQTGPSVIPRLD
ncbi:hypothetical protein [Mycolicibacter arupensis]|jgi:hypothetical protein|uniref:Uncharacterized protein n=1 Tax=Mycolicibacter arupensis TaxID=342002 RepID=A0A0F5MXA5_9MYCO|nr:hypothetical protein [Mycolicibacter arupensis]KKB99224.1 hypothetical protein WR43_10710 [Mycolicibacter arupensis]MCV7276840.1 hypothetical protein [Mycolicibacter arupensis]OQZ95822.1 hypothetical protein BST15_13535 [Mycolicibacter arupensis]TXI55497.1 MAG: hypothetical protein E6Q54_12485 [Mycolicibacter arupensis]